MYKIEEQDWGYHLTFGGNTSPGELTRWLRESEHVLRTSPDDFFVFVDMRTLIPLDLEAQETMQEGQKLYRQSGMVRSVVILSSPVVAAQFRRIGGETGIGKWERYLDASTISDWEEVGMNWLLHAVDPDQAKQPEQPIRSK